MVELLRDLWAFLMARRNAWLIPVIVLLVALGTVVVLLEGSALSPFIYSLF